MVVWAGRAYGIKKLPKVAQLFMDGLVTLYRWILAAKPAPKHGRASAVNQLRYKYPYGPLLLGLWAVLSC